MNIHKRTCLTLLDRQEVWRLYQTRVWKVTQLAEHFKVSRPNESARFFRRLFGLSQAASADFAGR